MVASHSRPAIAMNVLIVHAHPEPSSLTSHLARTAQQVLLAQGHEVQTSDLYAMGWKAVFDAQDFPDRLDASRLSFIAESGHAYANGRQSDDVAGEQRKLQAADALILAFPMWWFGMPAILKGWIDRVWAFGLAYGYRGAGNAYRYGEGGFAGKRALLAVSIGGPAADYGPRGINGSLDQLLFPITHGTLFYPGMQVLAPFALHDSGRQDAAGVAAATSAWTTRVAHLFDEAPLRFRPQNGGDYPDRHTLAEQHAPGRRDLSIHLAD